MRSNTLSRTVWPRWWKSRRVARLPGSPLKPRSCGKQPTSGRASASTPVPELPRDAAREAYLDPKTGEAVDLEELKATIFNHVYTFFSRYYDNGDFLQRHNGEEVYLHRANADQKEHFTDYRFKSGGVIHFEPAADTEQNNVKGEKRSSSWRRTRPTSPPSPSVAPDREGADGLRDEEPAGEDHRRLPPRRTTRRPWPLEPAGERRHLLPRPQHLGLLRPQGPEGLPEDWTSPQERSNDRRLGAGAFRGPRSGRKDRRARRYRVPRPDFRRG